MREIGRSLLFSVLFGVLGLALLSQALQVRPLVAEPMGPEVFPLVVSVLMIGAAFYNVLVDLISLRRQHVLGDRSQTVARSPEVSDGFQWKTPLVVGVLGVSYVLGLTFVGFFVSTFSFTLLTMVLLHHFERGAGLVRKALTVYLPLSLGIVAVLYAGIRALRIYIPTQVWLW